MPPLRIPIDGLWRCLCPSLDTIHVSQLSRCASSTRRLSSTRKAQNTNTVPNFLTSTAGQLNNYRALHSDTVDTPSATTGISNKSHLLHQDLTATSQIQNHKSPSSGTLRSHSNSRTPADQFNDPKHTSELHNKLRIQPIHKPHAYSFGNFDDFTIPELHDKLRALPSSRGAYQEIAALVHYLITVRGQDPALIHYDSLVRANADAEHGSVDIVKGLLHEMEDLGIRGDAGFYHAVLGVLAIHPDYVLRNDIMQVMKERWFGLSPEGWHWLIVGLIRDRHFEMAMDKLEQMQSDQIMVQSWLYDIFMFQLCENDELDAAWKLLKYRWEHDRNHISSPVWYYLLDRFSQGFHYGATKFIWKVRVQSDIIVPSDGICISVLNIAARYSDPGLATSVIRILSSRRATLASYHYEALISAYTGFGDLKTAFRVLTIMAKAGIEPTPSTTRPLYVHLCQEPNLPKEAWGTLKYLFNDGHVIPVAAVNVVIEAFIGAHCFDDALDTYKMLHTVCEGGPNTETFNILFQGCTRHHRKDVSMFLASEMHALGIPADQITYDRLILVCLKQNDYNDYEDAFKYLEEMMLVGADRIEEGTGNVGWWMRKGTATLMVQTCVKFVDQRVWSILEGMKERGMKTERLETWAKSAWTGNQVENGQLVSDDVMAKQEERLRQWKATN